MDKKKKREKGGGNEQRERERERKGAFTFSLKSKGSSRRFSSEQETKSVHATKPTHGYQNMGVSSNSKR